MTTQLEHLQCLPNGDGFYYFSVFLIMVGDEGAGFDIELNGELVCTACSDLTEWVASDEEATSCNAVAEAAEGMHNTDAFQL